MSRILAVGIIGVGHFGAFHVQKSLLNPLEDLKGIFDLDRQRAAFVAGKHSIPFFESEAELFKKIEAVIIATPATTHYHLCRKALEAGLHVFLEKPLSVTPEEGEILIALSQKYKRIFQVGHLLGVSLPPQKILQAMPFPKSITMRRSVLFSERGSDVSVVLDLMIHDLEFLFLLFGEAGRCLSASGSRSKTDYPDEAHARLVFKTGCQVDLFASRIAAHPERRICLYDGENSLAADFITHRLCYAQKGEKPKDLFWEKKDLLAAEHDYFAQSCLFEKTDSNALNSASQALFMADLIEKKIKSA